jgi:polyhydroxybutyrate depolymerase
MRNVMVLLAGILVLVGCAESPGEEAVAPVVVSLAEGDHEFALVHDGEARRYLVHVPPGLAGPPVAVVLSLHGGGGSAEQHQEQAGLDALADREGFVAVYPDGVGRTSLHTWNAGEYCCGLASRTDVDDVGYLAAVVGDLAARVTFETDRVVVAGHSNGAMMASRAAAERPDLFAAVVAVGAVAAPEQVPATPVPMMQIHSVDDPRARYEGGEGPPFPGTDSTVVHVAVIETLTAWAGANGCESTPVEAEPTVADNGHTATRVEWTGCDAAVVHLRLTGAGHGWPGAPVGRESVVGPATDVVEASEELWRFAAGVFDGR